ncbi:MAG: hypothetical protein ACREOU_06430 [Candidatus Eiseniibacteriota bacterium]
MRAIRLSLALLLGIAIAGPGHAALPLNRPIVPPGTKGQGPGVNIQDTGTRIDVNQVSMVVTNVGSFAFDLQSGNSGLEWPRGTGNTAVFASGIWIGAKVGGDIRVALAEYAQEYVPGPMAGGTFQDDSPDFRMFKANLADTTGYGEWLAVAVPMGAPITVVNGDTLPGIIGDQTLWGVYNDADPDAHGQVVNSDPLGLEVQQTTFAFDRQGALGNTVFIKYLIINNGTNTLDSTFISIWSDPDLGGFVDDLVGVDRPRSLGYCYNATNNDDIYGTRPPAVGFDYFQGPLADDGVTRLPMTAYVKYVNGTDPSSRQQVYNYQLGLEANGAPIINPTSGLVTTFMHDGDPVTGTGWLDTNPADRRLFLSSGPFTMAPGDTQEVVCAVIMGQGRDRLSSITALRVFDDTAQDAFDRDFILAAPPPQPVVTAQPLDREIVLTWGRDSEVPDPLFSYEFEGYNVYQGATVAGPWEKIATFDVVNSVDVIMDTVFDPISGTFVDLPVQVGTNSGLQYSVSITQDLLEGGSLNNGTQYYFAVTGYNYNGTPPLGFPKSLENSQRPITVIPQKPVAGTDLSAAETGDVTQAQVATGPLPTSDVVEVEVVDPTRVTGHSYEVFYTPVTPPPPQYEGQDVNVFWNLRDLTTGDTLLVDQINRTGNDDYVIVDGIKVKVIGSYLPEVIQDVVWLPPPANPVNREMVGVDWGGRFFDRGADFAKGFEDLDPPIIFDSALDPLADVDSFGTVEVRMSSDPAIGKAYRYLRDEVAVSGDAPSTGRGYYYGGFVDVPFTVWQTLGDLDPGNDIQIDGFYVERRLTQPDGTIEADSLQFATFDSTWFPDRSAQGGREYIFVVQTAYTDTPKSQYEVDDPFHALPTTVGPLAPMTYVVWPRRNRNPATDPVDEGDMFRFIWAEPATPNDMFTFDTSAPVTGDMTLAASQLDAIRVVPNPYYARSTYETDQFNRIVRFMNLPAACTIRIFTLAGQLVRTLEKNDPSTSVLNWDLETFNDLPVASGMYLYQIEAPGIGATRGRMVVFMEKERLNNF